MRYVYTLFIGYIICYVTSPAIADTQYTKKCMNNNSMVWEQLEALNNNITIEIKYMQKHLETINKQGRELGFQ